MGEIRGYRRGEEREESLGGRVGVLLCCPGYPHVHRISEEVSREGGIEGGSRGEGRGEGI